MSKILFLSKLTLLLLLPVLVFSRVGFAQNQNSTPSQPGTSPSAAPPVLPGPDAGNLTTEIENLPVAPEVAAAAVQPNAQTNDNDTTDNQPQVSEEYEQLSSMPFMLGDLLRANQSFSFPYNLAGDIAGTEANGTLRSRNPKVAENNSALPRNRISIRYNYFSDAATITGLEPFGDPVFPGVIAAADIGLNGLPPGLTLPSGVQFLSPDPQFGQFQFEIPASQIDELNDQFPPGDLGQFGVRFDPGSNSQGTAVIPQYSFIDDNDDLIYGFDLTRVLRNQEIREAKRDFNVNLINFGFESTFWENRASIEMRMPFARSVNSDLDLTASQVVEDDYTRADLVSPYGGTLGNGNFAIKDMQLIFKSLVWSSDRIVFSSGFGLQLPTASDSNLSIVDGFPDPTIRVFQNGVAPLADVLRSRDIRVKNQTIGLSPYLSLAATPTDRTFFNGFFQLDFPLGQDTVEFQQTNFARFLIINNGSGTTTRDPFVSSSQSEGKIRDQMLMNLDIGGGYWFYRNPAARRVTGLAGLMELHWTSTLQDADIFEANSTFLGEPVLLANRDPNPSVPQSVIEEDPIRIGNTANRMDIINATFGTTIEFSNRSTFSLGVAVPLQGGLNRTFETEITAQYNKIY
ncbi:hypothetical protein [Rubinisphaera italica]|uniref:Uncharacterized protein n=1 Tax=Rubinisphaera italica TaxID=2527969 RepID=A0A5C5XLL5_9PLAN|nr:hypothetical protein [Rubinisphaera italica]TWT63341.1 hypothetical protein Pan54_40940 [Rubinisphaera italica]